MVRGNRNIIVASTLLALPVALLTASLTTGTSPDGPGPDELRSARTSHSTPPAQAVAHANGLSASSSSGVLQAGTVPSESSGTIRQVGLLDTFAENRAKRQASQAQASGATSTREAQNRPSRPSTGLLSELFGNNNRSQPDSRRREADADARREARGQARHRRATAGRLGRDSVPRTSRHRS